MDIGDIKGGVWCHGAYIYTDIYTYTYIYTHIDIHIHMYTYIAHT